MRWKKLGLLFETPRDLGWMDCQGALLPFVEARDGYHRLYFSARDQQGRTEIAWADVEIAEPGRVLRVCEGPLLGIGPLGGFDDNGVTMTWLVDHQGQKYLYYSGWTLGVTVPFYLFIGLAISDDGGETFQRYSPAPIVDRNRVDPLLSSAPTIVVEDDGLWRSWYVSCDRWEIEAGRAKHYYHIRYAESRDGIHWTPTGRVAIDFKSPAEYAIARPCVVKDPDRYRMWYCYRGDVYRIGYAESPDGLVWERKDEEVGITMSTDGWDSEMVTYAFVFDHAGRRYMVYNGNGYGQTGIGLAVLEA